VAASCNWRPSAAPTTEVATQYDLRVYPSIGVEKIEGAFVSKERN